MSESVGGANGILDLHFNALSKFVSCLDGTVTLLIVRVCVGMCVYECVRKFASVCA